jgi:hypothetical protein
MSRILFQSAGSRYRPTGRGLVQKLQVALTDLGYNPGTLDGEFDVAHGSRYLLGNWALGDYPIKPGENL